MNEAAADTVREGLSGATVAFWLLSALVIGGALVTITRKNSVSAVMALVATFFGIAGLYAMLSAQFLAVIQILVYAGAIMTLFVFVVMVLNRDENEPWALRNIVTKALGIVAVLVVLKTSAVVFGEVTAKVDPPPAGWGGVADVGEKLFTTYLFPFEAISLALLVAVIGAVVVARTPKKMIHDGGDSAESAAPPAVTHGEAVHGGGGGGGGDGQVALGGKGH